MSTIVRDQVFISYSHQDQVWLRKVQVHLKPFERTNKIQVWDDTKIQAGSKWRGEREKGLCLWPGGLVPCNSTIPPSEFRPSQDFTTTLTSSHKERVHS